MEDVQKYLSNFRIVIASLPHRENCVCEIYYNHVQWAEISQEKEEVLTQFYSYSTKKCWEFPLDVALEVLRKAKERFFGWLSAFVLNWKF